MNTQNAIETELGFTPDSFKPAGSFKYAGHTFNAFETSTRISLGDHAKHVALLETDDAPDEIEGGIYPKVFAKFEAYDLIVNLEWLDVAGAIRRLQAEGTFQHLTTSTN